MKKILLGILVLSSLSFANSFEGVPRFSNSKFETNVEVIGNVNNTKKIYDADKRIDVVHSAKLETTIYDLFRVHGDVKYKYFISERKGLYKHIAEFGYKEMEDVKHKRGTVQIIKESDLILEDDSSIGVDLELKKYGTLTTNLKKNNELELGYKNSFNLDKLDTKFSIVYVNKLNSYKVPFLGDLKVSADTKINILDNLKLINKIDFVGNKKSENHIDIQGIVEYDNVVKSRTTLRYINDTKAKNSTYESIGIHQNVSYEAKDLLNVKDLNVTPEIGVGYIHFLGDEYKPNGFFELDPKVSGEYKATDTLTIQGSLGTKVRFSSIPLGEPISDKTFTFDKVVPELNLGLKYDIR